MSKKEVDTKVSENHEAEKLDFKGKTDEELKEIAQTLQTQLQQYQTMAVKAQGALEVVLQMMPEEENSEG
tara:strand:- start:427 stop:636 length:210 start_codon:yes stop_codon:yes gene_type:complete